MAYTGSGIASGPNREVLLSFSQTHFAPSRLFFILIYVFKMYVKRYQRDAFLFLLEHDEREREREREYPLQSVASDLYIISVWRYIQCTITFNIFIFEVVKKCHY